MTQTTITLTSGKQITLTASEFRELLDMLAPAPVQMPTPPTWETRPWMPSPWPYEITCR